MHQAPPAPPSEHITLSVPTHPGRITSRVRACWKALFGGPRRVVLLALLLVSLLVLVGVGLAPAAALGVSWSSAAWQPIPTPVPTPLPVALRVIAFYQGDPGPSAGWDSRAQFEQWWPSACSPAALTMTLRAWGTETGIGPVLDRLINLKAITPAQGLLHADALAEVAQSFGYHAQTFWNWSMKEVAHLTGQGVPVLLDVADAKRQTPILACLWAIGWWR